MLVLVKQKVNCERIVSAFLWSLYFLSAIMVNFVDALLYLDQIDAFSKQLLRKQESLLSKKLFAADFLPTVNSRKTVKISDASAQNSSENYDKPSENWMF